MSQLSSEDFLILKLDTKPESCAMPGQAIQICLCFRQGLHKSRVSAVGAVIYDILNQGNAQIRREMFRISRLLNLFH